MGNKFTKYLKQGFNGAIDGATNPKGLAGNWQHATRIFVDDTYRLSPKTKFLYYVHFDVNDAALQTLSSLWKKDTHGLELGTLVKRTGLPSFKFDTVTKNQYNRKRILHKTLEYQPVQLALHDDSNSVVSSLWALYYAYYIKDRLNNDSAYRYSDYATVFGNNRYGLDNNVDFVTTDYRPFFRSISVYTMSRRRYMGYSLINPRITSWTHGDVDYFASDTIESSMTLEYEAVKYSSGNVTYDTPKGFATLHYDTLPSPLTVQGGGVENLLGEGGVLDGAAQIFGDIGSGAAFESPGSLLATILKTKNTIDNSQNINWSRERDSILQGQAAKMLTPLAVSAASTAINALGAVFPKGANDETPTQQKKF